MHLKQATTYLEMLSPADLQDPVRSSGPIDLVELDRRSPDIREMTLRVGRPHTWPSQLWTDVDWEEYLARPGLRHWLGILEDDPIGIVSMDVRPPGVIEIDTFGLTPDCVGCGIGGTFLCAAVRLAWSLEEDVSRIWLHTSSNDHPHALNNYLARGFRIYRTVRAP
jgi:GNAT superfamily N-acetyltransferase